MSPATLGAAQREPRHVLLVEDDPRLLADLRAAFADAGWVVYPYDNALAVREDKPFWLRRVEVAVLDNRLSGRPDAGLELGHWIKEESADRIVTTLWTVHGSESLVVKAIVEQGFDYYWPKPGVTPAAIVSWCEDRAWLRRRPLRNEPQTGEPQPPLPPTLRRLRVPWVSLMLAALGLLAGVALAEILARSFLVVPASPFAHNPVIQRQATQVDLFEPDPELGHRLVGGRLVGVYTHGLVSVEDIAADWRRRRRRVVVNLGDSSTSGWDSNVVVGNAVRIRRGESIKSPFQNYRTYSDLMAERPDLYVVNAGIPGFTSIQGARFLPRLLADFGRLGVGVDAVTIYFGNNDSAWNGNIQDRYVLPAAVGGPRFQVLRLLDQATSSLRVVTRVTPADVERNLRLLLRSCRDAGVEALLVEPVVPRHWSPGLRAATLEDETDRHLDALGGSQVGHRLRKAQRLYADGLSALASGQARTARLALEAAREDDFLVPRIKAEHVRALRAVAQVEGVPLVSVASRIPLDDAAYFLDYCHPLEPANRLLAEEIVTTLEEQTGLRR